MSTREISKAHLERALVLIQWYLGEALRLRSVAVIPQPILDAETLSKWLHGRGMKVFDTRTILNRGPNPLRDKTRLMACIGELLGAGYITENDPGFVINGKKSRKSWTVQHVV